MYYSKSVILIELRVLHLYMSGELYNHFMCTY